VFALEALDPGSPKVFITKGKEPRMNPFRAVDRCAVGHGKPSYRLHKLDVGRSVMAEAHLHRTCEDGEFTRGETQDAIAPSYDRSGF
jgi:hypothetical protein